MALFNDLVNKYKGLLSGAQQTLSKVTPVIKQAPISYIANKVNASIPGGFQGGVQRTKQFLSNPEQYVPQQIPTFKALQPYTQDISQYVRNNYTVPMLSIPKNIKAVTNKKLDWKERGMGALGLLGGIASFTPDPLQDIAIPLTNYAKGAVASNIRGGKPIENMMAGIKSATYEKPVGLGTALTTNPTGELIGNIAELPFMLFAGMSVNKKQQQIKKILANEININRAILFLDNLDKMPKEKALSRFIFVEKLVKDLLPEKFNTKFIRSLANTAPSEYTSYMGRILRDALYQAKHPSIDVGFNVKPLAGQKKPIQIGGTGYIPEEKIQKYEVDLFNAEIKKQLRSNYSDDTISLFNRIKKMASAKDVVNGDVETLYKKNPKLVETAFQAVKEKEPNITTNDEAYEFILSIPTKEQTKLPKMPVESFGFGDQVYNAEPIKVKPTLVKTEEMRAKQAKAEFDAWQQSYRQKTLPATPNTQATGVAKQIKGATKSPTARSTEELQDISGFHAGFRDMWRNFKAVYGKRFDEVKRIILDPFDKSKGEYVEMQKRLVNELDSKIVKGLGIKKGSRESELVQLYGERKISLDELKLKSKNWEKIVEADAWFRKQYDTLLDEVNAVRKQIYPTDPTKIIPKRQDYYRHFRELSQGFQGLLNIFDTPAGISSNLSGVSEFTRPKSKFLSFAQKRLGGASENDAVGGFIDYIKSAAYAKHIDPNTARFRALAEELAKETAEGTPNAGRLNNFIEYLQDVANDLSGKTNPLDRTAQKWIPGGRKTFRVIDWLNSRVKANAVIGNLSSTIAQIFNVPQGIASAGPINSVKGLQRTMANIFNQNAPIKQSTFIKERYASTLYDRFDRGVLKDMKKFATWITGVLDEVGTKYIWNSHYEKALRQGVKNAVGYADDMTRSLVAGRGIGEVPLAQKSRIFQMIAPFQLEVGNLWYVMKDMVDEKAFGKIATLFVANYLFNRAAEAIRGSDVTFDPIQATIEGLQSYGDEEDKKMGALKLAGRLGGEVLSNVPVGQYVASAYPEYGLKIGDTQLPTRKDLFGKGDPTRYGTGPILAKAITQPQYQIIPPYGGTQIRKTIEGVTSFVKGASEDKKGNVRYPIEQNIPNAIKSAVFGQYATPEAKEYFDKNRRALSEKQTALYKSSQDKMSEYQKIIRTREENAAIDKAKEQMKNNNEPTKTVGTKILIRQDNGDIITIDPTYKPKRPKLTGNTELDKIKISSYNSKITAQIRDIVKLEEAGKITADEAEKKIKELSSTKITGPKKGKRPSFKIKKIKMPKIKLSKMKSIKVKKLAKLKQYKIKVPKIKTAKIKKTARLT